MTKLNLVNYNTVFTYNGKYYIRDIAGRDGNGKVAIVDIHDDHKECLPALTEVVLLEDKDPSAGFSDFIEGDAV